MRSTLARNGALQVIAQVTSDTFRDAKLGATAIALKLGVDGVGAELKERLEMLAAREDEMLALGPTIRLLAQVFRTGGDEDRVAAQFDQALKQGIGADLGAALGNRGMGMGDDRDAQSRGMSRHVCHASVLTARRRGN